jgi:carboxyl-terminal processing protease
MPKHSSDSGELKQKRSISVGFLLFAIVLAFVAGNRFQFIGDWFFSPYTNSATGNLSRNLNFAQTEKVYDLLKQKYDGKLDGKKIQEGINKGLVEAANDPYTVYLSPEDAKSFSEDLNGTFSGIGAELGRKNNNLVVISPLHSSPAEKAGLRANDIIATIDSKDATKLSVEEAVSKIKGEIGTKVNLGIVRGGELKKYEIVRAQINVPSVESSVLKGNIGYLKISRFSDDTAELSKKAAADFKAKKVKGVILDLRNNGGGLLSSSVEVAGIWLNNKVVVQEKSGGKVTATQKTSEGAPLVNIPTVVLINGGSASASEILAGALNDHKAATLIGEKTYGKGSVQELIDLDDGGKLKVTVARWYTPNGKNIDKEGIKPSIEVKLTDADYNKNLDPQKDRAILELK